MAYASQADVKALQQDQQMMMSILAKLANAFDPQGRLRVNPDQLGVAGGTVPVTGPLTSAQTLTGLTTVATVTTLASTVAVGSTTAPYRLLDASVYYVMRSNADMQSTLNVVSA